jgi:hypothetical protein
MNVFCVRDCWKHDRKTIVYQIDPILKFHCDVPFGLISSMTDDRRLTSF